MSLHRRDRTPKSEHRVDPGELGRFIVLALEEASKSQRRPLSEQTAKKRRRIVCRSIEVALARLATERDGRDERDRDDGGEHGRAQLPTTSTTSTTPKLVDTFSLRCLGVAPPPFDPTVLVTYIDHHTDLPTERDGLVLDFVPRTTDSDIDDIDEEDAL